MDYSDDSKSVIKCKRCNCTNELVQIKPILVALNEAMLCETCYYDWTAARVHFPIYTKLMETNLIWEYLMATRTPVPLAEVREVSASKVKHSIDVSKAFETWCGEGAL